MLNNEYNRITICNIIKYSIITLYIIFTSFCIYSLVYQSSKGTIYSVVFLLVGLIGGIFVYSIITGLSIIGLVINYQIKKYKNKKINNICFIISIILSIITEILIITIF